MKYGLKCFSNHLQVKCPKLKLFWTVFSAFELNKEFKELISAISPNAGKYGPEKTTKSHKFHAKHFAVS